MSEEQANQVIKLRHRLRALAMQGHCAEGIATLEELRALSHSLGDPDLVFEAARWSAHFEHLASIGRA